MSKMMSRKKSGRRPGLELQRSRKTQVVIVVAMLLSLFAAWTLLAYSGAFDSAFNQKGKRGRTVSTASFNSNSPSKEYVYAGGRLIATEEPSAATAPTNLNVKADTVGQISLSWSWTPSGGEVLDHFIVERRPAVNGNVTSFTTSPPTSTSFTDTTFQFGSVSPTGVITGSVATYLYQVKAVNTAGSTSTPSNFDLVTAISFSQDPIQKQVTIIRKQDLAELRVAVNAVRTAAALLPFNGWTDPDLSLSNISVKTENVTELRDKLADAYNQIPSLPAQPSYTDPTLVKQQTLIMKEHFNEIRRRVRHRTAGTD